MTAVTLAAKETAQQRAIIEALRKELWQQLRFKKPPEECLGYVLSFLSQHEEVFYHLDPAYEIEVYQVAESIKKEVKNDERINRKLMQKA